MSKQSKSKAQVVLFDSARKGFKTLSSNDHTVDFPKKLIGILNPEQAAAIISEQAGLEFDAQHPELHEAVMRQPELDKQSEISGKHLEELELAVKSIPPEIKSNAAHVGSDKAKVTFGDWAFRDQMSFILIFIAVGCCLVMSGVNVYSNLMSSGEPVYVENWLIPFFISLLAPSCSIAIKFIGHIFEHNYSYKKCFTNVAFLSSAVAFIVWIALFSNTYSGAASVFDWGSIEPEKADLSSWLAFTQLLTEVLIGGALFLALQDISLKYSPDYYEDNLAYIAAVKARDTRLTLHKALQEQRIANHTLLTVLQAKRQAYINEKLAEFIHLQTRFASINNF